MFADMQCPHVVSPTLKVSPFAVVLCIDDDDDDDDAWVMSAYKKL